MQMRFAHWRIHIGRLDKVVFMRLDRLDQNGLMSFARRAACWPFARQIELKMVLRMSVSVGSNVQYELAAQLVKAEANWPV